MPAFPESAAKIQKKVALLSFFFDYYIIFAVDFGNAGESACVTRQISEITVSYIVLNVSIMVKRLSSLGPQWRFLLFVGGLTLMFGLAFSPSELYTVPNDGWRDSFLLLFYWLLLLVGVFGLTMLLAISRRVFAVAYPLLIVACTAMTYYRYTAHAVLTPMMIDLLLVNDWRTDVAAMSWLLLALLLLALAVAVAVAVWRWRHVRVSWRWALLWLPLSLLMVYVAVAGVPGHSQEVMQRMPFSFYDNVSEYLAQRRVVATHRPAMPTPTGGDDSLTVVLVVGESLRADHLGLNGYCRNTTPLMAQEPLLVSLPNVSSRYSLTHLSLPHMLTRADDQHPERAYQERSFLSMMRQAGFRTAWLSNQESGQTFVYFMQECDTLVYANRGGSISMFDAWLDEDLLPLFDEELSKAAGRQLILLHTIGSHWFYNAHFTPNSAAYKPLANHRVVMSNTVEQLTNSYDNTIRYSDWLWKQLIDRLRQRRALLIYLSDHGESLGEDGNYWHGADREEQLSTACFVWFSSKYMERYPSKVEALRHNANRHLRHDFLFHSILTASNLESTLVDHQLDIFR